MNHVEKTNQKITETRIDLLGPAFLQEKKGFSSIMRVKITTKILKIVLICKFQIFFTEKKVLLNHVGKNNYQNTEIRINLCGPAFLQEKNYSLESCGLN